MTGIMEWIAVEILGFNCTVTFMQHLYCCGGNEFTITVNTKTQSFLRTNTATRIYRTLGRRCLKTEMRT
jgi:hypothetical protein